MTTPTLTDSGLETWLVFHRSTDLPDFAAFPLLDDPARRELLTEYFRDHLRIAAAAGTDLVLETPTSAISTHRCGITLIPWSHGHDAPPQR